MIVLKVLGLITLGGLATYFGIIWAFARDTRRGPW